MIFKFRLSFWRGFYFSLNKPDRPVISWPCEGRPVMRLFIVII